MRDGIIVNHLYLTWVAEVEEPDIKSNKKVNSIMSLVCTESPLKQLPARINTLYIAYSGGQDSQVLLHMSASQAHLKSKMIAVYINHGLQQAAAAWGEHCRQQCLQLGVQFRLINVNAKPVTGQSPEEAARDARYVALKALLHKDDVLLFAQHREDQMETMLLQLFRGSGLTGLAAMPVSTRFGQGTLIRPLLNTPKQHIQNYAIAHQLHWVEDPSNRCDDFDRNYLRNQIIPLLKTRWPALDKTVARSAAHCANAEQLLNDWVEEIFPMVYDSVERCLLIDEWLKFTRKQGALLLRHWLQIFGLKPPSQAVLQAIISEVINAKSTANPQIMLQGFYIKKYRDKLYCLAATYFRKAAQDLRWPAEQNSLTLSNGYALIVEPAQQGIAKDIWHSHTGSIRYRSGGETIKLPGRAGHHSLKNLYQAAGIPPWERDSRPLLYLDGQLAAVAGLWVAEWAWQAQGDCYRLLWQQL